MAIHIYPTEAALGDFRSNPANRMREYQLVHFPHAAKQSRLYGHRLTGGAVSAGSGLSVDIAAGEWLCYGRWISSDAVVNVASLTPSATNYIYLQLTFAGNLVSGHAWVHNTTGTPPAYSVCVGKAVTNGTVVTGTPETPASNPGFCEGTFTGNGAASREIFLGFQPSYIQVFGDDYDLTSPDSNNPFWADGAAGGGFNTAAPGRSTSPVEVPVPTAQGFTVGFTSDGTDRGLNLNGEVRYWRAFA